MLWPGQNRATKKELYKSFTKMKAIAFLLAAAALLSGCATADRARSVVEGFADYRPYTTAGMFISPDPYTGTDYTAIGEYRAVVLPAMKMGENRTYKVETINSSELLKMTVEEARKKGANGVVDYRVNTTYSTTTKAVESYEVSALFILIHEVVTNE